MTTLTFYCAVWLMLIVGPFCCLIGVVWSMRSLNQNEGSNSNRNNDGSIKLRAIQGEWQGEDGHHRHIVEQFVGATDDKDDDDVERGKKAGIGREENIHKAARKHNNKKKTAKRGRRRRHEIIKFKNHGIRMPADVVLLVDATSSTWLWFMERINRIQNITRSLALQFQAADHRNRIAIAQFDFSHGKILLELGKWRAPRLKRAIRQLKEWPGEYEQDEALEGAEQYTAFTAAFITAKNVFKHSLREEAENNAADRIAIVVTDGVGTDRFHEAKILREQFNVRIIFVLVYANAESAKNNFNNDPNYANGIWRNLNEMVSDPENDIIFDQTGICHNDLDCENWSKCFFSTNSAFGHNLGFCGCLPPGSAFDKNKYSVHDCCRMVSLPYNHQANLDGHFCY